MVSAWEESAIATQDILEVAALKLHVLQVNFSTQSTAHAEQTVQLDIIPIYTPKVVKLANHLAQNAWALQLSAWDVQLSME